MSALAPYLTHKHAMAGLRSHGKTLILELRSFMTEFSAEDSADRRRLAAAKKRNGAKPLISLRQAAKELGL